MAGIACKKTSNEPQKVASTVKQMRITFTGNPPDPSHVDFRFDNADRVANFFIYMGDSGRIVPSADSVLFVQFLYTGSNKLPNSLIVSNKLQGITQPHYLAYNPDGKLSKDSIPLGNNDYILYQYNYTGSYIINDIYKKTNSVLERLYIDTLEMTNGNLTTYTRRYSPVSSEKVIIDYDNKSNPLYNLNISQIFIVLGPGPTTGIWSIWTAFTKNNQTALKRYHDGVLQSTNFLEFQYNNLNLPSYRLWRNQYNQIVDTLVYKY